MKKILGTLLLVVILWLSATAIIGSKTQSELEKKIENINRTYLQHGIQFKITEYQKSFFSSMATIEMTAIDKELESAISQTYGVVFPIVSAYQIEHGPLFFSNGLGVGISKIHQEMEVSSIFNEEIKKSFVKKSMITSDVIISFSKMAHYDIQSDAIEIAEDAKKLHIDPFTITGESHIETLVGDVQMKIPLVSFAEDDKKISIESTLLDSHIDELLEKSLGMGTINLSIERLYIGDKENGEIDIQPTFHIESQKDGEKTFGSLLEMQIKFNKTTAKHGLSEIEQLVGKVKMSGLGIKGVTRYQESMQEIQQKQASIMLELQKNPKKQEENYAKLVELQKEIGTKLFASLKDTLFKDKTSINYAFNIQTKDKKESRGDILLGYTGDIDFNQTVEQIRKKIGADMFNLFKLEVDIRVDENHIKSLPNGKELLQQLQTPMAQNMITHKNEKYTIKGHLKNQELVVNDNNLTNTILPMLKMLTQVGMAQ